MGADCDWAPHPVLLGGCPVARADQGSACQGEGAHVGQEG